MTELRFPFVCPVCKHEMNMTITHSEKTNIDFVELCGIKIIYKSPPEKADKGE